MNLTNQTIQKARLILDKPPTPLTFKQITDLVSKPTAPLQQLTLLFISKHRADLIVFVLKNFVLPAESYEGIFASACKNLLKYCLPDLRGIWKLILEAEAAKCLREKWGIQRPMRDAFLITNEAEKELLFQLLASNVDVLLQLNQDRMVEGFVIKYAASFIKYNVYLAPVPALASQCLAINSKAQIKLLDSSVKKSMLQRAVCLLRATHERKLYTYQNNCMSLVVLLAKQPGECFLDLLDIYECQKILELYLWNKPTREQGRRMQQAVEAVRQRIGRDQRDKMDYRPQFRQASQKKVPLIENVIDRAMDYQQKQKTGIARQRQENWPSRPSSSHFLKKGLGHGGGKAQISNFKSPAKRQFSSIDQIVQNCFTQNQQHLFSSPSSLNNKIAMPASIPIVTSGTRKVSSQSQAETVSVYSSNIQEGEQWTQISNLIDLAYQYKFG